jgi:putative transposase
MNRVRRGENIFGNTDDYERFIALLQEVAEMFTLRVSVFCLMPNHYHILEQTPQGNQPTTQQESSKDLTAQLTPQHVHAPASTTNLYSYLKYHRLISRCPR